jgi:uncharacterized YigZ family protein
MPSGYKTLANYGRAEIVEKKSRFIGTCMPVQSEEEALDFIARVKSEYKDATHNVHAFLLKENGLSRCTDDGEPSGTAGRPVLETLSKAEIFNAAIVVTRYFGGTLLGTGGLVRAYSKAASEAIAAAGIAEITHCTSFNVNADYAMYEQVQRCVMSEGAKVINTEFAESVKLFCVIKTEGYDELCRKLTELSNGRIEAEIVSSGFEAF